MNIVPSIPNKLLSRSIRDHRDPKELLYFYVRKLVSKSQNVLYLRNPGSAPLFQFYDHAKAANIVYGDGLKDKPYITRMLDSYAPFFEFQGAGLQKRFRPDMARLKAAHPQIFQEQEDAVCAQDVKLELLSALRDERKAVQDNMNKVYVPLRDVRHVDTINGVLVFTAQCVVEYDDQVIQLPEGVKVKYKNLERTTFVTVLEYNNKTNTVIFQTSARLNTAGRPALENSPVYLIDRLLTCIERSDPQQGPFSGLVERKPKIIAYDERPAGTYLALDESQQQAVAQAIGHSITYIWGPPGTGKSFTLATLLLNVFLRKERTLVCAIANVAVDGLTSKLIEAVKAYGADLLKNGEILRIGYVQDKELKKIDALFPEDRAIRKLREHIGLLEGLLENLRETSPAYASRLSELQQVRHTLSQILREKIQKARIVLCTSSKALLEEAIMDASFENLVIDEGSMMSPPTLAGLIEKVTKRVVIAGDFRQLGPIALSHTALADKWLHTNLFDLLGTNLLRHPALSMITQQRRCAGPIIELVNKEFYEGRLISISNPRQEAFRGIYPGDTHVSFVDLGKDPLYVGDYSSAHSRYNRHSLTQGMLILQRLLKQKDLRSVGIITPYKAQVHHYQKEVERFTDHFRPSFQVRVGTIHSFQGSECEVI
ncbi:MAG TPA: AAA domain-containing protein, partial [Chitinophagaceae bacterium]|nr:AAA domain-containing protein [Chitinophagaceae bacterium]